jgi:hypothetical protein
MYKDTHEQGAEGNTWIQEADTDRKTNKTAWCEARMRDKKLIQNSGQ